MPATGVVSLIGAGPGDPGLLTVRAVERLRECDAVVYDALVGPALMQRLVHDRQPPPEIHFVGKRGGGVSTSQDAINALLVRLARAGKRVVRLKGGDPLVFGRGSEEAQALAAARIPFEIVPGVTSGVAAPAYAGIPVTHRGMATSVTFVTGHEDPTKEESGTDWTALARTGGTLVLYMGVKRLGVIAKELMAAGMSPDTPAAIIEWGTYPRQRTVTASLAELADVARHEAIAAPSITVIGDVVRLRQEISWFEERPLHGRRIVVTRARTQASELRALLEALGADVMEAPTIRIEPLDRNPIQRALGALERYQWAIFTSQNAVELAWDALRATGADARAVRVKIAAVGPATASALEAHGLVPDVVPHRHVAEGLVEALRGRPDVRGSRVLFPKAEGAREVLPAALREMGATVDEIAVYRSVRDDAGLAELSQALAAGQVDLVTFTSSSTVQYFVEAVGRERASQVRAASMGPVTTETLKECGVPVTIEARSATLPSLVDAIVAHFAPAPPRSVSAGA